MYQDADTPALPCFDGVTEPDGAPYSPTSLWIDLFNPVISAQKLIDITGWSVFTLVRSQGRKVKSNASFSRSPSSAGTRPSSTKTPTWASC
jgi:hypothetical protein